MAQYAAHVLRQHHQQQAKPYSRRTPAAKPYSCDQCGRGFKYLHTLRFHIKTTHDSAAPAVEPRLSRLRRDAQSGQDLSQAGSSDQPDSCEAKEEDLSVRRVSGERCEPDAQPLQDRPAEAQVVSSIKKEALERKDNYAESYGDGSVKMEDSPSTSCLGSLGRMGGGGGLPSPPLLNLDSWRGMKLQSEIPLAIKLSAMNPLTEQQYTLYKCGICGETHPSLRGLCEHLQEHARAVKEHHCDKCGAAFKWRSQLLVHEQVHQVIEGKAGGITLPPTGLLNSLPEALIGEPRVSFDQAIQLGALAAGQQLLPGFLQPGALPNIAMSLPLSLPGTTSVVPSSSSSLGDYSVPVSTMSSMSSMPSTRGGGAGSGSKSSGSSLSAQEGGLRLPFQCSYCSKSFDRIFSLQRHERIHTGVKPCYCKACGRGFSERRNLRHHIIRFHSDVSQRDQLRRRRRAAAAKSRAAAVPAGCPSSSASANGGHTASSAGSVAAPGTSSLKLVSFLKKTAVRILNSMDQSKADEEEEERAEEDEEEDDDMTARSEDGTFLSNGKRDATTREEQRMESDEEETVEESLEEAERQLAAAPRTRSSESPTGTFREEKRSKTEEETEEEDNRTIIYPLDGSSSTGTEQVGDTKTSEETVPTTIVQEADSVDDTKKPTTGNRRKKGKPMRYGPAVVADEECCEEKNIRADNASEGAMEDAAGKDMSKEGESDEGRGDDDSVNPYSKEEMAAWMQLGKQLVNNTSGCENGEANASDANLKARQQGHGPFFSGYNPRLDMVERPVSRDEACKPQLGPDGRFVYPCSYCYKTFCSTSDLNRHMDFHEGNCSFKLM